MESEFRRFASGIDQKVMIVETAYPFDLGFNDQLNNVVGLQNQLTPGYPATKMGQYNFMLRIHDMLKNLPDQKGIGYCYWAPDWVSHDRANEAFINGSNWENLALFDFNNKVIPALEVYSLD